jgi:hypothetical protein
MNPDQEKAQMLLRMAEQTDGYQAACQASPVNRLARRFCQYIPWPDQSEAPVQDGVHIVILSPSADGGMPHTRAGNLICLPAYFPRSRLAETLAHERVHLDQRNRPLAWRQRLQEEGWSAVEESELPSDWVRRCRLNPDTFAARFWAWEGRYVPLPVFVREDKPELRDIEVRWYDRQEKRVGISVPLSYRKKYGTVSQAQMEHPYELHAYKVDGRH